MPTVIDSLLVTLGLDSSGFAKGQQQAQTALKKTRDDTASTAKQMQADGAKAAEFFGQIKTEALSLFGVLLGAEGIKSFINDTSKSLRQLGFDARSIGEDAGQINAFTMAIERMGGTASGATSALQSFASQQANAKIFGDAAFVQEMGLIGGNIDTSPLEAIRLFMAYIEKFKNQPGGIQSIEAIASKLFPGIDKATLQAMEQMGSVAELTKQIAESKSVGVATPEMIEHANKLQEALTKLGQAAKFDGEMMEDAVSGGLTSFLTVLASIITQSPAALAGISALGGYLTVISVLRWRSLLEMIAAFTSFLELPALAAFLSYKAVHIGGLNEGEDAELKRLRAAHGMNPDGTTATTSGSGGLGAPLAPDIEAEVRRQAAANGLDPDHMVRLAQKESGGYDKVSSAGAFGPMQLMPRTAAHYGVNQSSSWQENIRAGMQYYAEVLKTIGGNYAAADAAYNAGPANPGVARFAMTGDKSGLPAETQDYVTSINSLPSSKPGIPSPPTPVVASSTSQQGDTTHITIGNVNVQTQANDANGIARDLSGAIMTQANRGPQ